MKGKGFIHDFSVLEQDDDDLENIENLHHEEEKKRQLEQLHPNVNVNVRKNIIRYLYIIVDYTDHLRTKESTMKNVSRHDIVFKYLKLFVEKFIMLNPLSKIGLITTQNERAKNIQSFTSNSRLLNRSLDEKFKQMPKGKPSLQNSLNLALNFMSNCPQYSSKEILIFFSSISTVDPGDVRKTIEKVCENKISISVIGFGSKLYILENMTKNSFGKYFVPINENDFLTKLMSFTTPLPEIKDVERNKSCLPMGFPIFKRGAMTPCYCHKKVNSSGYFCPKCNTKYCDIPRDCDICGLSLVSYAHLAISLHHLYPVKSFKILKEEDLSGIGDLFKSKSMREICYGCQCDMEVGKKIITECSDCKKKFCIDCDVLIHDSLHTCPGCCK